MENRNSHRAFCLRKDQFRWEQRARILGAHRLQESIMTSSPARTPLIPSRRTPEDNVRQSCHGRAFAGKEMASFLEEQLAHVPMH